MAKAFVLAAGFGPANGWVVFGVVMGAVVVMALVGELLGRRESARRQPPHT